MLGEPTISKVGAFHNRFRLPPNIITMGGLLTTIGSGPLYDFYRFTCSPSAMLIPQKG